MPHSFKYWLMFLVYLWLRFDPVLRLGFGGNWTPRGEFLKQLFNPQDAEQFLKHRGKLVAIRRSKPVPYILPSDVEKLVRQFLKQSPETQAGRKQRLKIINRLIFWATNPEINRENIDSYKTRLTIIDYLLEEIFTNSLVDESTLILSGLKKIVFSRVTYLGQKGEPSPVVHNVILNACAKLLQRHFSEILRLREKQLDKMTTMQIIKELNKSRAGTGSLAFSGEINQNDEYRHKFPLPGNQAFWLYEIVNHYRFSAWPDSRDQAKQIFEEIEDQIKIPLKNAVELLKNQ